MQCGRVMSFFLCSSSLSSLIRFIKNRKKEEEKKKKNGKKLEYQIAILSRDIERI
jgi:hypothetical protein